VGAQVRRGLFTSGHTCVFHTSMASSSRSIARRNGTWAGPTVPAQQLPHALEGVADVEHPADQELDALERPALELVIPAVRPRQ
jgi:hypothetical protein